jgi:hypothetical protein
MKKTAFWAVTLCNVVDVHQHFRGECWLQLQDTLKVEAAHSTEELVNIYQVHGVTSHKTVLFKRYQAHS